MIIAIHLSYLCTVAPQLSDLLNQKLIQTTHTNIDLQRHTTSTRMLFVDADVIHAHKFGF